MGCKQGVMCMALQKGKGSLQQKKEGEKLRQCEEEDAHIPTACSLSCPCCAAYAVFTAIPIRQSSSMLMQTCTMPRGWAAC
eukprot:scaffold167146_cov44-Tisochrysis_lutea.AAC.1